MTEKNAAADHVRWDLSIMYSDLDDPQIDQDIDLLVSKYKAFNESYKGELAKKLPEATEDYIEIGLLMAKIEVYLYLVESLDVRDDRVKAKIAQTSRILEKEYGDYMTFFEIELVTLDKETLSQFYAESPIVAKHRPWIEEIQGNKPYMLSEEVESALIKRSSFGSSSWSEFSPEVIADIEISFKGKKMSLEEILEILSNSKDRIERHCAMISANRSLKDIAKFSAQTLYMVTGSGSVEDQERGYKHPMTSRNLSNRVEDSTVEALHKAVENVGGPIIKRFYRLKAAHLGLELLRWSDRNAPMPFADTTTTPFDEAMKIVLAAYESFSPTLAQLVRTISDNGWIDAPVVKGKRGSQFNYTIMIPGGHITSFIFLQYFGSGTDVMTPAHELGQGLHGLLAHEEQGPLMAHAPCTYNETASIFGEMVTFDFLKRRLREKGDRQSLLALLMDKISGMTNTIIRQICFSNFERRIHGMDETYTQWNTPKKLSVEEVNKIWLDTTKQLYGEDGEVFSYDNLEYLWSYIIHFHRPFYVYGYAFGELLTQSLYAQRSQMGENFEPLYLELLKSGSTKGPTDLLRPFSLNPADNRFWADGINNSLKKMVQEAEELSRDMGVSI